MGAQGTRGQGSGLLCWPGLRIDFGVLTPHSTHLSTPPHARAALLFSSSSLAQPVRPCLLHLARPDTTVPLTKSRTSRQGKEASKCFPRAELSPQLQCLLQTSHSCHRPDGLTDHQGGPMSTVPHLGSFQDRGLSSTCHLGTFAALSPSLWMTSLTPPTRCPLDPRLSFRVRQQLCPPWSRARASLLCQGCGSSPGLSLDQWVSGQASLSWSCAHLSCSC